MVHKNLYCNVLWLDTLIAVFYGHLAYNSVSVLSDTRLFSVKNLENFPKTRSIMSPTFSPKPLLIQHPVISGLSLLRGPRDQHAQK